MKSSEQIFKEVVEQSQTAWSDPVINTEKPDAFFIALIRHTAVCMYEGLSVELINSSKVADQSTHKLLQQFSENFLMSIEDDATKLAVKGILETLLTPSMDVARDVLLNVSKIYLQRAEDIKKQEAIR